MTAPRNSRCRTHEARLAALRAELVDFDGQTYLKIPEHVLNAAGFRENDDVEIRRVGNELHFRRLPLDPLAEPIVLKLDGLL